MKKMRYAMIAHEAEEGGYWAEFPDLPGCVTEGKTLNDLRVHAVEAVALYIETLRADGKPIPATAVHVEMIETEGAA